MVKEKIDFKELLETPLYEPPKKTKDKDWAALVKRVEYRPGYMLDASYEIDFVDVTKLVVKMTVENTYNHGQMIPIIFQSWLPPWRDIRDDQEAMQFIRQALHDMERHESDEWIRLDGEMIFNPHAEEVKV